MKPNNFSSKKQEAKLAKEMQGKSHISSGRLWFQKFDASNYEFIFDQKTVFKDYFRFDRKWFKEAVNYAATQGKNFAIQVEFIRGNAYVVMNRSPVGNYKQSEEHVTAKSYRLVSGAVVFGEVLKIDFGKIQCYVMDYLDFKETEIG